MRGRGARVGATDGVPEETGWRILGQVDAETEGIIGGPARRWDFGHAGVVERLLLRVETGVGPHSGEFRSADAVGPVGVGTLMTVDGRTAHDVVIYWM